MRDRKALVVRFECVAVRTCDLHRGANLVAHWLGEGLQGFENLSIIGSPNTTD